MKKVVKSLRVGCGVFFGLASVGTILATIVLMIKNLILLSKGRLDLYVVLAFVVCLSMAAIFVTMTSIVIPEDVDVSSEIISVSVVDPSLSDPDE